VTYIDDRFINMASMTNWYTSTRSTTQEYNVFLNNCSTQVKDALVAGGLLNDVGGVNSPTTLTSGIRAEITRREIIERIGSLF